MKWDAYFFRVWELEGFLIAKSKLFVYYQALKLLILTLLFFGLETNKWHPGKSIFYLAEAPL